MSRRREYDKKRDEREREEISAFFQQKQMPGRDDSQGRKQSFVSGLSRPDAGAGDTSTYHHSEHRDPQTKQKLHPARDSRPEEFHDQTERRNREASRASKNITWSTSHKSPDLNCHPTTASTEKHIDKDKRSPTPSQFREALARSGIFNNTGITYSQIFGFEGKGHGTNPKDGLSSAESPTVDHLDAPTEQAAPIYPVRIVRYQDRGTMADQDTFSADDRPYHTRRTSTPTRSIDSNGGRRFVARDTTDVPTVVRTLTSTPPVRQSKRTDAIKGGPPNTTDTGASPSEGGDGLETRPERPKSPKWTVIERLEAAAENLQPLDFLPAATRVSQVVQEHTQPVSTHDVEPTIQLAPVQMPCSYAPDYTHKSRWSVSRVAPTPGQDHKALSALSTKLPSPLNPGEPFVRISPPHVALSLSVAPNHGNEDKGDSFAEYQNTPMSGNIATAQDFLHQQRIQQSMQDYISQIEEEVLGRAQDDSCSRTSPIIVVNHLHQPDLPDLAGDEPSNIYTEPYIKRSGSLRDGSLSTVTHQSRMHAHILEEDEEQRFMSSFWRPNRYPV